VPQIPPAVFRYIIEQSSPSTALNLIELWNLIEVEVYSEDDPLGRIGFRDENG